MVCSGKGECIEENHCRCVPGASGEQCETITCYGFIPSSDYVCSGHGDCVGPKNCSCFHGYFGSRCEKFACNSSLSLIDGSVCSGHGNCVDFDTCVCHADSSNGFWFGEKCEKCQPNYKGSSCTQQVCDPEITCSGRGECVENIFSGYFLISKGSIRAQNFRNLTVEGSIATEGGFSHQVLRSTYGKVNIKNQVSNMIVAAAVDLYKELSSLKCEQTLEQTVPTSGLNLKAGVYCFPQGLNGGGRITVSGGGKVILILRTNLNAGFTVGFIEGAMVGNLFWVVSGVSSISGNFYGNLLTTGQVNVNNAFITGSIMNIGGSELNLNAASFKPFQYVAENGMNGCQCFGNYASPFCDTCSIGYFGPNCTLSCSSEKNCNGRGQCSESGSCLCGPRFVGPKCELCSIGWLGSNCNYFVGDRALLKNDKLSLQYGNPTPSLQIGCAQILLEESLRLLGSNPQCNWEDKSANKFIISLGLGNTIQEGSTLKFQLENGIFAPVPVYQDPTSVIVPPTAILRVSPYISTCGRLELDASASFSLDRRFLEFTYQVLSGPSENAKNTLRNGIAFFGSQAIVSMSAENLQVGSYVVQLNVKSDRSGSGYMTASFEITSIPSPTIEIPGGLIQSVVQGSVVVINPQIELSCNGENKGLIFEWEQVSGESQVFSKELNNRILLIRSFDKSSQFKFKISSIYDESYKSEVVVTFTVKASGLILKINGGTFRYGSVNEPLLVDFSNSYDPSNTPEKEEFTVECFRCPNNQIFSNINVEKKFTIPVNFLVAGIYQFTITYSKGNRSKSETVVVNLAEYIVLDVFIKTARNDFLPTSVPLGIDVGLEAVSPPDIRNEIQYIWSSRTAGFILDNATTITGIFGSSMIIRGGALSPDAFYTIRLDASWNGLIGFAEYNLAVNTPPKSGELNINPLKSTSGVDTVTLTCSGWQDENGPLSYQFFYNDNKNGWQALTSKMTTTQVNIMLPVGYGPSDQIIVKARVYDSLGSFSEVQHVVVSSPPSILASKLLSFVGQFSNISIESSLPNTIAKLSMLKPLSEETKKSIEKVINDVVGQELERRRVFSISDQDAVETMSFIRTASDFMANLDTESRMKVLNMTMHCLDVFKNSISPIPKEAVESFIFSLSNLAEYGNEHGIARMMKPTSSIYIILNELQTLTLKYMLPNQSGFLSSSKNLLSFVRRVSPQQTNLISQVLSEQSKFELSPSFSATISNRNLDIDIKIKIMTKNIFQNFHSLNNLTTICSSIFEIDMDYSGIESNLQVMGEEIKISLEGNFSTSNTKDYDCTVWNNDTYQFERLSEYQCTILSISSSMAKIRVTTIGTYAISNRKHENQEQLSSVMSQYSLTLMMATIVMVSLLLSF